MMDDAVRSEFQDSIRRALSGYPDVLGVTKGRGLAAEDVKTLFASAAENGWTIMAMPEEVGGLGLGLSGAALLATEIGRAAAPGPLMATCLLGQMLTSVLAPDLLAGLADGSRILTLGTCAGFAEDRRYIVEHAAGATDVLLLDAEAGGELRLGVVGAPDLAPLDPFDPLSPVGIFDGAESFMTVRLAQSEAAVFFGAANLWIAAELLGVAERAGEMAIGHAGERQQFGHLIGTYQGVKHRIVDDYVARANAAAILSRATNSWDGNGHNRLMLAHAARVAASEAALAAAANCIQVHGGMGFSWEHPAHLYFKRARRLVNLLGSEGESRASLGKALVEAAL